MIPNYSAKISLIIPAYNEEKYIGKCLESVLENSHGKLLEIIVVDNASTDNTSTEVKKYINKNVRLVEEKMKGVMHARQRGYIEARGDILAFIDADSEMPTGWIDKMIEEFTHDQTLACLSGPYNYYDLQGYKTILVAGFWNCVVFPLYFFLDYMGNGGNFVLRKEVLKKMNGFDTSIDFYGDDTSIARNARRFGKVKFRKDFTMNSSARRLVDQGILKTGYFYTINYLSQSVFHRSATTTSEHFR